VNLYLQASYEKKYMFFFMPLETIIFSDS